MNQDYQSSNLIIIKIMLSTFVRLFSKSISFDVIVSPIDINSIIRSETDESP